MKGFSFLKLIKVFSKEQNSLAKTESLEHEKK